jgi:hypothetical protein
MNLPFAFSPLLAHIPHAVPVVIIWGIMLRFYLVHRKLKNGRSGPVPATPATDSATRSTAPDRPVARRVWAVDDDPQSADVSSGRQEVPVLGRTPAGRL